MKKSGVFVAAVCILGLGFTLTRYLAPRQALRKSVRTEVTGTASPTPIQLPPSVELHSDYQVFQSFNNCGPAALSMDLRYYGIVKSQEELGQALRPYQVANGENDDKSVSMHELAEKAKELGFVPYHRPSGNMHILKSFIAAGMPVIVSTWLHPDEDIGHYRVVNGYDDGAQQIIQQDSMEGKDIRYSYDVFNDLWEKYNYEYLVLVPKDKIGVAERILGEDKDVVHAWQTALHNSLNRLKADPENIYERLNASTAYFYLNDYTNSIQEFERIEAQLPARTLWYQTEPIEAYVKVGNDEKASSMIEYILEHGNRAYSELYMIRGDIYEKRGDAEAAQREYGLARYYNIHMK